MSALARFFNSRGVEVSGSDSAASEITSTLEKEGISIFIDQAAENIPNDVDCIIYTLAIADDNPEMIRARQLEVEKRIEVATYAQMLGQVSSNKKTIAISGTHGKTTTTAMIDSALRAAGLSPTTIVGSLIKKDGKKTNYMEGEDDWFVAEACEYKRSFLNLNPHILVITNIEADHLDYYKDLADIKSAFMELADKVPSASDGGRIICDFDSENLQDIIKKHSDKVINWRDFVDEVPELKVIGEHNILNAASALGAISSVRGVNIKDAKKGLADFTGTWRRLEFHGENENGAIIYDDYAHHPSAMRYGLTAIKEKYPNKNLVVIFHPHLYSRTKDFFDQFVDVLKIADEVFILPIYAAREKEDSTVSNTTLADAIPNAKAISSFDEAKAELYRRGDDDVVITIGAGDVYKILD